MLHSLCLCRKLLEVDTSSLSFSPWPLNNYQQTIFSVQNVRGFFRIQHLAIGNTKTYYLFISNVHQQWLSTAVTLGHAEVKWQESTCISESTVFLIFFFLFQEFSSTKIMYALLNCERLLKLSTGVLISDTWLMEKWACRNDKGKD